MPTKGEIDCSLGILLLRNWTDLFHSNPTLSASRMPPDSMTTPASESAQVAAPGVIDRNRALLNEAQMHVYKTVNGQDLTAYVFHPKDQARHGGQGPHPAVAFFYSSTWDSGLISQFAPQCLYFAHRGMVAILFDYRVSSRHGTSPTEAMQDARSALRWLRINARALKVNPDQIIAAGGAAGAQLAASAAMLEGFDDLGDDPATPCKPDALILFNPILDTTRKGSELEKFPSKAAAKAASPIHHARRKLPPMLIFHGTADRVIPCETSRKFCRKLRWRGNDCRLSTFDGCGHGFFNFNVDATLYELTLNAADAFLVEKGFLSPPEEVDTESRLARI